MTMKTTVNVTCDGENCTHTRAGDTNHWLVGVVYKRTVAMSTARPLLTKLTETGVVPPDVKDFCGEECAIKWVSKILAEMKHD